MELTLLQFCLKEMNAARKRRRDLESEGPERRVLATVVNIDVAVLDYNGPAPGFTCYINDSTKRRARGAASPA